MTLTDVDETSGSQRGIGDFIHCGQEHGVVDDLVKDAIHGSVIDGVTRLLRGCSGRTSAYPQFRITLDSILLLLLNEKRISVIPCWLNKSYLCCDSWRVNGDVLMQRYISQRLWPFCRCSVSCALIVLIVLVSTHVSLELLGGISYIVWKGLMEDGFPQGWMNGLLCILG